jgi:hypothetical protein
MEWKTHYIEGYLNQELLIIRNLLLDTFETEAVVIKTTEFGVKSSEDKLIVYKR